MKNDHVIIDGDKQEFRCNICNKTKKIELPAEIKWFAIAGKTFIKAHRKCAVKNCYTCVHLEWSEGDHSDPSGFTCWKRLDGMNETQENFLLKNLSREKYLKRWKPCFEQKDFKNANG